MRFSHPLLAALSLLLAAGASQAGWSFGFSVGAPYRHYYRPYHYYRPAVIVAPTYPVYVAPPPVVVQPAPVVAVPASESGYEPPVPDASPVSAPVKPAARVAPVAGPDLAALSDPSPKVRAEAIIKVGREKDARAVKALTQSLKDDGSAEVREAAARALGLIGSPASLSALQHAAQADDDRDVRKSASFAAEVIRSNMRR